jgi:hypothetical protein
MVHDMTSKKKVRSSWIYAWAVLVFVLGCAIGSVGLVRGIRGLPRAFADARDLSRLTQVVVPGTADLTLSRTGAYAVYHEYQGAIDGVAYARSETPPELFCALTANDTGSQLPLVPDYVESHQYTKGLGRGRGVRTGVLIMSTTVDRPGEYTFSCRYPDGREQPKIVLAVGQNIVWEEMRILAQAGVSVLGSLALVGVLGAAAVVAAIATAIKRHSTRKQ